MEKIFFLIKLIFEVYKALIKKGEKKRKITFMNTNIFEEDRMSPLRENLYSSNTINILRSKPGFVEEAPKCLLVCYLCVSFLLLHSSISITLNKLYLAGDMNHENSGPPPLLLCLWGIKEEKV